MNEPLVFPSVGPHPRVFVRWWMPLARAVGYVLLLILGPVRVWGADRVPRGGGLLILVNHLSDVDPVVVQYACPRPIHFMAKSELFGMPVIGWLIRKFRGFPVRRGEPDRQALKYAVSQLKAGEAVGIFPEGEISEGGKLLELKSGVGLIARMSGTTAICCGLQGTQRIIPYGKRIPRPAFRTVRVRWGEPCKFDRDAEAAEILAWARAELLALTDDDSH